MELLLYAAVLAIIGVSMTGFFSEMYDYYYNVQIKSSVTQNLRYASQTIQQAVRQSQSITTASGTTLILAMTDATQNPTEFGLDAGTGKLYKKIAGGDMVYITPDSVEVTNVSFSRLSSGLTKALNPSQWAWSGGASASTTNEGVGWIDFNPSSSDVRIPIGAGDFLGMAYIPASDDYISLNCLTTNSCSDVSYKVYADASGTLHGWAWSDAYGWLSFNSAETTSTVPYSVSINQTTGSFSGYAWSENIGWLSFNCLNTDTCGTVSYLVRSNNQQATPVNTVNISLAMKYRSLVPKFQYSDTYTLSVPALPVSTVRVTGVSPATATSTFFLIITGTGFQTGAVTKLSRSGFADVFPTTDCVFVSSESLQSCQYDLTGKQNGLWDVVVTNADGEIGILPAAFAFSGACPSGADPAGNCNKCVNDAIAYQTSSEDLFSECAASYNACSGNNRIGPDGNCNGSGACNTGGLSSACSTAGTCQTGGGCSGGSCVAVTNQTAAQDLYSECGAIDCHTGATKYYNAWTSNVCYYKADISAANAVCDGAGACKTAAVQCAASTQGVSTGVTRTTCKTQVGCTGTTAGSLGNVASGSDTYSECGAIDCHTGATKYYNAWTSNVCYYKADISAANAVCDGAGACRTAAVQCVASTQGVSTGVTQTTCTAQVGCTGTTAGSLGNTPNGQTGLNCTALHYRCNGSGACTAPYTESGCVGAASGHDATWKCVTYLGYDMCMRSYGSADMCGGGCYYCEAAVQGCNVGFYSAICANWNYD